MSNLVLDGILVLAFLVMTLCCIYWKRKHQKNIQSIILSPMLKFMIRRLKWLLMIVIGMQWLICLFLDWRLMMVLHELGCDGVSVWFVLLLFGAISMWFSGIYITFSLLSAVRPKG